MDPHILPNVVMNQITPGTDCSMNLVISNKIHMIMYALNENCAVTNYKGDHTYIATSDNMNGKVVRKGENVPPEFFPIVIAIAGGGSIDMKSVRKNFGPTKAMKLISEMLEHKFITKNTYDIDSFLNRTEDTFTEEERERIKKRFDIVNIRRTATQLDLANIESQFINKFDWDSVMQLNNKYFYHHPINLEFAVDGEEYE
jgi:hypothetical protein